MNFMIGLMLEVVCWLLFAFFCGQLLIFIGLLLWVVWTDAVEPRLIPSTEINRVARDIIDSYPDPEQEAFARHERAWYRSDGAEQAYWYRVRKAIKRRQM